MTKTKLKHRPRLLKNWRYVVPRLGESAYEKAMPLAAAQALKKWLQPNVAEPGGDTSIEHSASRELVDIHQRLNLHSH